MFRETLLCHNGIPLDHEVDATATRRFWLRGRFTSTADAAAGEGKTFEGLDGVEVKTWSAIGTAVLACLDEAWPSSLSFPELAAAARTRAGDSASTTTDDDVAETVWYCVRRGLVQLRVTPDRFRVDPGDHPRATTFARLQAAAGTEVTNLRHERVPLDLFLRRILLDLDGSDWSSLVERLRPVVGDNSTLETKLDAAVRRLGRAGMVTR